MRFHLDEHVDQAVARGLRSRGLDVTTTAEAGLLAADDEAHLEFARREARVVVTHDADFLRLSAAGENHDGIVYCPPNRRTVGEIVRYLCLMNDCLADSEVAGTVTFI